MLIDLDDGSWQIIPFFGIASLTAYAEDHVLGVRILGRATHFPAELPV